MPLNEEDGEHEKAVEEEKRKRNLISHRRQLGRTRRLFGFASIEWLKSRKQRDIERLKRKKALLTLRYLSIKSSQNESSADLRRAGVQPAKYSHSIHFERDWHSTPLISAYEGLSLTFAI